MVQKKRRKKQGFNTRVGARWFSDEYEIEDDDYVSIPVWVRGGSFA